MPRTFPYPFRRTAGSPGPARAPGLAALAVCLAAPLCAGDKSFTLDAPAIFEDSGLAGHLLPRFSLKTGIRITLASPADLTIRTGQGARAVFETDEDVYFIDTPEDPDAQRFADWLTSEIGANTLAGFTPAEGQPGFAAPKAVAAPVKAVVYEGDVARGASLALQLCGRCHVVGEVNRLNGLGSTPSFAVLRTFPDWGSRFEGFFALNPHPAFTQVAGVTAPFDISLPSPIAPVELTLDDLDAILAFVSVMPPANLGAPIAHQ